MMKKLAAALAAGLLALLLVVPASVGSHFQTPVERLIAWTGCTASVVTSDEHQPIESHYRIDQHAVYIGTAVHNTPLTHLVMIVLHESGHCLQMQRGYMFPLYQVGGQVAVELDADRLATDLACGLGLDGPTMLRELFAWALETYEYDGDDNHGTLEQRIDQANHAMVCRIIQAPKESPMIPR